MKQIPRNLRYSLAMAAIVLAAGVVYLAGSGRVGLFDQDEALYAQTSRQMLRSGDWVLPKFLDQPRYAKPIFIYWCQAASMKLFGEGEFAARLPSAVGMTLVAALLATAVSIFIGQRRAMYTVLIFCSSAMVIVSAKMCLTDAVMLVFITLAQVCLFALYRGAGGIGVAGLMWVCVGLAGLTKGPFVLGVLGATMVMLALMDVGRAWRSLRTWGQAIAWWKRLRPLMGITIVAAIVLPWLIVAYRRDSAFLANMLLEPVRHARQDESGQQINYPGWGYYLLIIWVTFFPWCLFLPMAIVRGWRHRRTPPIRFAMATVLGNWIFLELLTTKLSHYLLPVYSSLAFLVATALIRTMRRMQRNAAETSPSSIASAQSEVTPHSKNSREDRRLMWGTAAWGAAAVAMAELPWLPATWFAAPRAEAAAFVAAGFTYTAIVVIAIMRRRLALAAMTMGLGMLLVVAILYALYLPKADYLWLPRRVGERLLQEGAVEEGQVAMIGFTQPSLPFYQGGTIRQPKRALEKTPVEHWPRWIAASDDALAKLPPEGREKYDEIASFRGFNYNVPMGIVKVSILKKKT